MKKGKEQNLFGEANEVFNTLHSELTFVNEDIEKVQKAIKIGEEKIEKLEERKAALEASAKIAKRNMNEISQKMKK